MVFTNAFVTTAVCAVSRASVLTGQYARRHAVDDFFKMFSSEQLASCYPSPLRSHGYYTGFTGKWGVAANDLKNLDIEGRSFNFWAGASHQSNFWHGASCRYVRNDGVNDKLNNVCTCPADARGFSGPNVRFGCENIKDPVHLTTEIVPTRVEKSLKTRDKSKPFYLSISLKLSHQTWID